MNTITPENITAAKTIGRVTLDGPEWLHISLDQDRSAQITPDLDGFAVYLQDAWTPLTRRRERIAATFTDALDIARTFAA